MAARGAASERMAAAEAASGFGRIGLAWGLAVLGDSIWHDSSPVLGVVPLAWSRFLSGGTATPTFLSASAPRVTLGAIGTSSAALAAATHSVKMAMVVIAVAAAAAAAANSEAGSLRRQTVLHRTVQESVAAAAWLVVPVAAGQPAWASHRAPLGSSLEAAVAAAVTAAAAVVAVAAVKAAAAAAAAAAGQSSPAASGMRPT